MVIADYSYASFHWKVVSETEITSGEEMNTRNLNVTVKSCAGKERGCNWLSMVVHDDCNHRTKKREAGRSLSVQACLDSRVSFMLVKATKSVSNTKLKLNERK